MLICLRQFNTYQMITGVGCMLDYDVLNMFLISKERYAL